MADRHWTSLQARMAAPTQVQPKDDEGDASGMTLNIKAQAKTAAAGKDDDDDSSDYDWLASAKSFGMGSFLAPNPKALAKGKAASSGGDGGKPPKAAAPKRAKRPIADDASSVTKKAKQPSKKYGQLLKEVQGLEEAATKAQNILEAAKTSFRTLTATSMKTFAALITKKLAPANIALILDDECDIIDFDEASIGDLRGRGRKCIASLRNHLLKIRSLAAYLSGVQPTRNQAVADWQTMLHLYRELRVNEARDPNNT